MPNRLGHLLVAAWLTGASPLMAAPHDRVANDPVHVGSYFEALDVFALRYASDPQVTTDGKRIAFVVTAMDIKTDRRLGTIHVISSDGSSDITVPGSEGASAPRWSPDGTQLVFRKDGRLWLWADGAPPRSITEVATGVEDPVWSPDGSRIAFLTRLPREMPMFFAMPGKPDGADWAPASKVDFENFKAYDVGEAPPTIAALFVVDINQGATRRLTYADIDLSQPAWVPDGTGLLVSGLLAPRSVAGDDRRAIYRISLAGGDPVEVPTITGTSSSPTVSPKGDLAFLGTRSPSTTAHMQLWIRGRDGVSRLLTATIDRDIRSAVWSRRGDGLYILYADQSAFRIGFVDLKGRLREIASGVGPSDMGRPQAKGAAFSVAADGSIAFVRAEALVPGDVALATPGQWRRLTRLSDDALSNRAFGPVEEIRYSSSIDGLPIQAWLTKPPNFQPGKRYPLILLNHGGPWGTFSGPYFSAEAQIYAAAGYLVLAVNYRGSGSYGQKFSDTTAQAFPGHDFDDTMDGVDALIGRGLADPDNLFVTGGSAGGVLTAWTVGHTDRFRAAVAQKPVVDLASFVLTTDSPSLYRLFATKPPWADPAHYRAYSPMTFIEKVVTPTLLIVGTNDVRTPVSQAESFYNALRLRGIPTALVRLPGAGHEYSSRPSQLIAGALATLGWFEKYRTGAVEAR